MHPAKLEHGRLDYAREAPRKCRMERPIPDKETNIMRRIVTLFVCIWLAVMSADGKPKDKSKGNGKQGTGDASGATLVNVSFGASDVRVIQHYYGTHPTRLPPGLQKKLARGKPLPPGWQKKLQPFPSAVAGRLSTACGNCGRGVIDGYGVIYDKKTAVILDIVQLAADVLR
jgi:hypothetical protein